MQKLPALVFVALAVIIQSVAYSPWITHAATTNITIKDYGIEDVWYEHINGTVVELNRHHYHLNVITTSNPNGDTLCASAGEVGLSEEEVIAFSNAGTLAEVVKLGSGLDFYDFHTGERVNNNRLRVDIGQVGTAENLGGYRSMVYLDNIACFEIAVKVVGEESHPPATPIPTEKPILTTPPEEDGPHTPETIIPEDEHVIEEVIIEDEIAITPSIIPTPSVTPMVTQEEQTVEVANEETNDTPSKPPQEKLATPKKSMSTPVVAGIAVETVVVGLLALRLVGNTRLIKWSRNKP